MSVNVGDCVLHVSAESWGGLSSHVMSKLKVWAKMLAAAAAEGTGRARSEDNFLSEWRRMRLSVGLLSGRVGLVQSSMRKLRGNVARSTTKNPNSAPPTQERNVVQAKTRTRTRTPDDAAAGATPRASD